MQIVQCCSWTVTSVFFLYAVCTNCWISMTNNANIVLYNNITTTSMPLVSRIHGYIRNVKIFLEYGLNHGSPETGSNNTQSKKKKKNLVRTIKKCFIRRAVPWLYNVRISGTQWHWISRQKFYTKVSPCVVRRKWTETGIPLTDKSRLNHGSRGRFT